MGWDGLVFPNIDLGNCDCREREIYLERELAVYIIKHNSSGYILQKQVFEN